MKLPENKNERVKILALIAMGAVLVLYGLAVGVVQPLFKGKKESSEKIVALQEKLTGLLGAETPAAAAPKKRRMRMRAKPISQGRWFPRTASRRFPRERSVRPLPF